MNVLVVYAHPYDASFNAHLRDRVLASLNPAHEVRVLDLYGQDFNPRLSQTDLAAMLDGSATPSDIVASLEALQWANTIVFVYPTWWSGPPAMLKGWLDRVMWPGIVYDVESSGRVRGKLHNVTSVIVISTHGSSKLVNVLEGETGRLLFRRVINALFAKRCRTKWVAFYTIDRASAEKRAAFVKRVEQVAQRI